jgi:hypothetical protein
VYLPDFLIIYDDRNGERKTEMLEIKPEAEMPGYKGKVSKLKEARQVLNMAKWEAALGVCRKNGWKFRVATEKELFAFKPQSGVGHR